MFIVHIKPIPDSLSCSFARFTYCSNLLDSSHKILVHFYELLLLTSINFFKANLASLESS